MGNILKNVLNFFDNSQKDQRILMLGLDAAGKTTLLYSLKLGEVIQTVPTVGFNVEEIQYKKINFCVWDVGGQDKLRPLWRHYYRGVNALIYVVDSSDCDRHQDAREELHGILQDKGFPDDAIVLVYANKQDLPNALKPEDLAKELALESESNRGREWFIQPSIACQGDGLFESLDWLCRTLKKKK